jgi:hypothetical protein
VQHTGRDKSFVYDLTIEPGTVRVRVASVPRSTEVQPGFVRFDTFHYLSLTLPHSFDCLLCLHIPSYDCMPSLTHSQKSSIYLILFDRFSPSTLLYIFSSLLLYLLSSLQLYLLYHIFYSILSSYSILLILFHHILPSIVSSILLILFYSFLAVLSVQSVR